MSSRLAFADVPVTNPSSTGKASRAEIKSSAINPKSEYWVLNYGPGILARVDMNRKMSPTLIRGFQAGSKPIIYWVFEGSRN